VTFVAVEKEPPFAVGVYTLSPAYIRWGRAKVDRAIDILQGCLRHNSWPGYGAQMIEPPTWVEVEE
jgi:exodeoxyribonuclease VIII